MKKPSRILEALALRYERSQAGRTGEASRDVVMLLTELLEEAGCSEGESRALAERELAEAEAAGVVTLVPFHKRDRSCIHQIRLSPASESALYSRLGRPSPTKSRAALAEQFKLAATAIVPQSWHSDWRAWCDQMCQAALDGSSIAPFDRVPTKANSKLLTLLPKLLAWEGESLVRFVSCVLCGDSKMLEELAAIERTGEFSGQLRGKVGRVLEEITHGAIRTLDDLGILPNPRSVLVHGPLTLLLEGKRLDLGTLRGPFRLSQIDVDGAQAIETLAPRCITVENETTFHELAKIQSGELLVCTSYPGSATLALLKRLPASIECWHFGDSDEPGFDILRVLREKSGRNFRSLHMQPGRIPFEQEALGRPTQSSWPFYMQPGV